MYTSKNPHSARSLVLVVSLFALTFCLGCPKVEKQGTNITGGSKIVIVGGTVKVRSSVGFASETDKLAVISDSRRHVSLVRFPDKKEVQIPPNATWGLEVQPTGLTIGSLADTTRRVVSIQPRASFAHDTPDDAVDGEGKSDSDDTDPTGIVLTINGATQPSRPFKTGDRVEIEYPKDY